MENNKLNIALSALLIVLLLSVFSAFYSFQKNTASVPISQPQPLPVVKQTQPAPVVKPAVPTPETFDETILSTPQKSDDGKQWKHYDNKKLGISFSYPDYGKVSRVSINQVEEGFFVTDIKFQTEEGESVAPYFVTEVSLGFLNNSEKLSLLEWFRKNVDDETGSLLASGACKITTLPNGKKSIMSGLAPIPDTYLNSEGPIGVYSWTLSQSGRTIITISPSQDGYRPIPFDQFNKILETAQAP